VRVRYLLVQRTEWRTTPYRLFMAIHSQLPFAFGDRNIHLQTEDALRRRKKQHALNMDCYPPFSIIGVIAVEYVKKWSRNG
jgi:hypothetical protein